MVTFVLIGLEHEKQLCSDCRLAPLEKLLLLFLLPKLLASELLLLTKAGGGPIFQAFSLVLSGKKYSGMV